MKIYVPSNLKLPEKSNGISVYGWIDKFTTDIFICSFSEPNWFPEFEDIGMEKYEELGYISFTSESPKSIQLSNNSRYLNIPSIKADESIVLIYYKIFKELSTSADFTDQFSTFPLKQVIYIETEIMG